ncbi:flagellar biosynthesis protein FlhF [Gracilibacillus sp. YIM 98692]|uniref:flagellar biosynthesis protein FlhF n=1 Tax=Gracilibacillus sp. YIM 98692 TaxID=2663532 RepID=UPI0013D74B19|nr:flagellar biosynthesis protein FlhF [Gracilibacillus sp. YIM 98692]
MKVKKFKGNTMPEVMQVVRKELGADAVILQSREVQEGGIFGLFKKKKIEVHAAIDPSPISKTSSIQPHSKMLDQTDKKPDSGQVDMLEEIQEMKHWFKRQVEHHQNYPDAFQSMLDKLVDKQVNPKITEDIVDTIYQRLSPKATEQEVWNEMSLEIRDRLANNGDYGGLSFQHKVVALVGPTGVGKTTTIAKLAAHYRLKKHKHVAFITTDTYRIAAIDQLKTYAEILDVPLEVAYNADDYQKAKEKFQDYDIIFVDTAGRNFLEQKYVEEISQTIELQNAEAYLVLSLATKKEDLESTFNQFKHIPLDKVIFTKKDETSTYGAILNICLQNKIGVAYFTNGQDVPDDIETVSVDRITELVIGGANYD